VKGGDGDDIVLDPSEIDLKALKFEPILNVSRDVSGINRSEFVKCSVNSDLELLFIKPFRVTNLICVNMVDCEVIFKPEAYAGGNHSNHWRKVNGVHYLSVHCSQNMIKSFVVNAETKQFTEDVSRRITLSESDVINHVDYDMNSENVFLVKNSKIFEQRSMFGDHSVIVSVELEGKAKFHDKKWVSLSNDGRYCAIATGDTSWYLVDIRNQLQFKLISKELSKTYNSTFIEGDSLRVVIGGNPSKCEIWDVETRSHIRVISDIGHDVLCVASVNNVLAVGTWDKVLQLYDANSWEKIYSKKYGMNPLSLQLTPDLKYLTMAGDYGEFCLVLKISG